MTNVYFIKKGEEVKIGRSADVSRRLEELQVSNSELLEVLYVIENVDESFEQHVQSVCQLFHIRGEWFYIGAINHLLKHPYYAEAMKSYSRSNS
jgi:hypothetical protein